jgi:hypothetical protein
MKKILILSLILLFVFSAVIGFAASSDFYVCELDTDCNAGAGSGWSTGNDGNNCTDKSTPCATVGGAIDKLQALSAANQPGSTMTVGDGTYSASELQMGGIEGNASNYVTMQAENQYGAVIEGTQPDNSSCPGNTYAKTLIANDNFTYVTFKNFHMKYGNAALFFNPTTDNDQVHHLNITDNKFEANANFWGICAADGCGESIRTSFVMHDINIERNVFLDVGNAAGSDSVSGCECSVPDRCMSHEHAIYAQGWHLLIQNNLFYNIKTGWAIKVDQSADEGSCPEGSCWSHKIINNSFNGDHDGDISSRSGDIAFIYNNSVSCQAVSGGCSQPHDVVIANNVFYNPSNNNNSSLDEAIHNGVVNYGYNASCSGNDESDFVLMNNVTNSLYLTGACTEAAIIAAGGTVSGNVKLNDRSNAMGMTDPDGYEFTLTAEASYLIDTGSATYAPSDDHIGTLRPLGPGLLDDIGAYEFEQPTNPIDGMLIQ